MAHNLQERYSALVLAKLRQELVLKDGIVFNTDYDGDPKAGVVQIPVRSTEVTVGDYNKASGGDNEVGTTTYLPVNINKDKYVNEVIDGYDAAAVPDNLVADRLDSAAYALAAAVDYDGSTELLTYGKKLGLVSLSSATVYDMVVDIRTAMSKDNIPNDGRRYLLVTPDAYALMLKDTTNFIRQGDLAQRIKETGAIGQYAGFNLYEWNDSTASLLCIAGHPSFATRVTEFKVPPKVVDLDGSAKYIGASAVKARLVYAHKVTESKGVRACYYPAALTLSVAADSTVNGKNVVTITGATGTTKYRLNPAKRVVYGQNDTGFTALTSGSTAITANDTDLFEVVDFGANGAEKVGYAYGVDNDA